MEVSVKKPGSPSDILEHSGKKGMKWGVRNTPASETFNRKFSTSQQRTREIHRARSSVRKTTKAYERQTDPKKREKLRKANLKNPDRATALRITRGEKVTVALVTWLVSPTVLVPATIGGLAANRMRKRRKIERGDLGK